MPSQPDLTAYDPVRHENTVMAWRRARLARLTAEDSWLSLQGRFELSQGDNSVGGADGCAVVLPRASAPDSVGTFTRTGQEVSFTPAASAVVSLQSGATRRALDAQAPVSLESDRSGVSDKLCLGSVTMEVIERSDGVFVRVRDPQSQTRSQFPGLDYYPIDPKWRVVAKLEPYQPQKIVDLGYQSGSSERYLSPGAAVFDMDGVRYSVDPVLDGDRPRLYLVFWDLSARDTTYGAGRFLYAPLPQGDRVVLDFNQAFSPPCAFTPYAVCPLPPAQNRLSLRVEAGEKRPLPPSA